MKLVSRSEAKAAGERKRLRRLKKYGLSVADYGHMLTKQNGKCFVCSSDKLLCVDHCHVTGKVRKLLCMKCNTSLGKMGNDPVLLRRLAEYAESHQWPT